MERQGCVDANVSISGLDRNERYYISLATERGLGFSNQSAQRNLGFANLTGHRIYKFYFPLIACGRREFGTVTAEVRESPSNKLVATKTAEVTVAPERPVMGSYLHKKECLLTALFGELSSAGGWMSNGAAYSATTALFSGVSLSERLPPWAVPQVFIAWLGLLRPAHRRGPRATASIRFR